MTDKLIQSFQNLHVRKKTKTRACQQVFGLYRYLIDGWVVPCLDAPSLAAFSLVDTKCAAAAHRRTLHMRVAIMEYCKQDDNCNNPREFAWDALYRTDFKWRLHTAWLAGVHINDYLFYNHFQHRRSRAIDAASSHSDLWNFLIQNGATPRENHNTFGTYRPSGGADGFGNSSGISSSDDEPSKSSS